MKAVKIYPAFKHPTAKEIEDYFLPLILKEAERLGKPIILRLPQPLWHSLGNLLRVIQAFPELVIVLAHMGLCYLPNQAFLKTLR